MALLTKVKPGDPLKIPAETFNAFVEAARDFQERQRSAGRDSQRDFRQAGIVLVRNESGADRDRFEVLGIEGPIIKPGINLDAFKDRVALRGVVPRRRHKGRFAILLEPAAVGETVRAVVDGVCPVRVKMVDECDRFADVRQGVTARLESAPSGAAYLLWIQPKSERDQPTIAWTIARIGVPASAPPCSSSSITVYLTDSD